jgi:tetratricopeptide (TPR) repeat protein
MWGRNNIRRVVAWASALMVVAGWGVGVAHGQRAKVAENEQYVDKRYDFRLTEPYKWYRGLPGDVIYKSGVLRKFWLQDELTGMLVAIETHDDAMKPSQIDLASLAEAKDQKELPVKPNKRDVRVIGAMKAAWFEVSGRGLGFGLKEEGSVPTRQVWVVVPRGKEWIVFVLGAPEANYDRALRDFKKMLKTAEIGGKQTKAQAADPAVDPDADEPDEVDHQAEKELSQAEELRKARRYAEALKVYDQVGVKYAARKAGKTANERARELREDPAIVKLVQQAEQDAKEAAAAEEGGKWLKTAREMAKAQDYDLARKYYRKIIDKYPGTKLAKTAEEELKKLPQ